MPQPPQYQHTTLLQARTALTARLQDPNNIYWQAAELNLYIVESLRMFQSLSLYYRDRELLNTVAGTAFYDLTTTLVSGTIPNAFNFNVTDQYLIGVIQYMLLEPSTGNSWTGTPQFTFAQVSGALQRVRDRFLLDSGQILTKYSVGVVSSPPVGRENLADTVMDIRRADWTDSVTLKTYCLWREDEWAFNSFIDSWQQTPGLPTMYSVAVTPPVQIQIAPVPLNSGTLKMTVVNSGPALTPATTPTPLGIRDDWTWVIKWGTLAELLNTDGQSRDPQRAAFCQQMYDSGVEAAKMCPSVMQAQVNNIPVFLESVANLDFFQASWQSTSGQPTTLGMMGQNLLACAPVPNAVYSITLDLIRNMVVPAADTDYLQVGREQVESILDMAQWLACFKMSGQEWQNTQPMYQNFIRLVGVHNAQIRAASFYKKALEAPGNLQDAMIPRLVAKQEQAQGQAQ